MMKFESFPNEIIMECFEYLSAIDIFHSFDQLNHRFSKLIRSNPLHINFDQINKPAFNQFCQTIVLNPEIKKNIIYLQLSNKGTCGQIDSFLSLIPLNELISLRSLLLLDVTENNVQQLLPMLPFLSNLYSFSITGLETTDISEIISLLPKTILRILSVTCLTFTITCLNQITGLTSLTVLSGTLYDLFHLFKYVPMLKYLKIQRFEKRSSIKNEPNKMTEDAVHLKEFIIDDRAVSFGDICEGDTGNFEDLQVLLKNMPNLKILSIRFTWSHRSLYDANRWENLLKSSLEHLSVFKFFFSFNYMDFVDDEYYDLKKFQSDFWTKRHCYTTFAGDRNSPSVYTIPYMLNEYVYIPDEIQCSNSLINKSNVFDNVKKLTLFSTSNINKSEYYFRNVETLILRPVDYYNDDSNDGNQFKSSHIKFLDIIVNLSNIKHLTIDEDCRISPSIFLNLIKRLASLSSLTIDKFLLMKYFRNDELCQYLNRKIKKLDILNERDDTSKNMIQLCQVFSNVEQLTCRDMDSVDELLLLLATCSKLSILKIENINKQVRAWIKANASTSNIYFDYE